MRSRSYWAGVVCSSFALCLAAGCGQSQPMCEDVIAVMEQCQPGLSARARCGPETVAEFERMNLADRPCAEIQQLGKADLLAIGGCGPGEHVCNWLFCCDDYELTWSPTEPDWDIIAVVETFEAATPAAARAALDEASDDHLRSVVSRTYVQPVAETVGGEPVEAAVEITRGLIDVPYETFIALLPPETWGVRLAHYLGGEVEVYERDAQERATRQLERMVLSPLPCDLEGPLSNNDMTKVERIVYGPDSAKVYWRVMHSDNNSTVSDVGSVEFRSRGAGTLVTFHSAHRLNALGGIPIPLTLLRPALAATFTDFVEGYGEWVNAELNRL